jgi:hypothetical protein
MTHFQAGTEILTGGSPASRHEDVRAHVDVLTREHRHQLEVESANPVRDRRRRRHPLPDWQPRAAAAGSDVQAPK